MPDKRLGGVRVLVTRPAHQAQWLVGLIDAAGGQPVLLPTIEIAEPRDPGVLAQALVQLPQASYLIFISRNAAEYGLAWLRAHGGWPPNVRFAAVGAATARTLQAAGVHEVLVPTGRFDSEALLELLPAAAVRGRTILLFRGEGGREHLADTLAARGAHVQHAVCYRRVLPARPDTAVLARLAGGEIDIVTVGSVEGLHNLITLAGEAGQAQLRTTPLLVTSERQAAAARAAGWHAAVVVAARADDAAIVDRLIAWRDSQNSL